MILVINNFVGSDYSIANRVWYSYLSTTSLQLHATAKLENMSETPHFGGLLQKIKIKKENRFYRDFSMNIF